MSEPATKEDLASLKVEIGNDLVALKMEIGNDIAALKEELVEAFRDGQTELLKAFYGFMQTVQNRFQEDDQTEASMKRRITTLESRILEIEKRLSMPPGS
jgi:hypothetical protein